MLDLTKTYKTRDGRPAVILATGVPLAALRFAASHAGEVREVDTVLVEVDGKRVGYQASGQYLSFESRHDLVAVPQRTTEFRTFAPERNDRQLGRLSKDTLTEARYLASGDLWDGVLEIIREDDKVVDVKFHPKG